MFGLGVPELLIIAFIVVVLFGYKRIPEIFGGLGKGIRDFKKGLNEEEQGGQAPTQELHQEKPAETKK